MTRLFYITSKRTKLLAQHKAKFAVNHAKFGSTCHRLQASQASTVTGHCSLSQVLAGATIAAYQPSLCSGCSRPLRLFAACLGRAYTTLRDCYRSYSRLQHPHHYHLTTFGKGQQHSCLVASVLDSDNRSFLQVLGRWPLDAYTTKWVAVRCPAQIVGWWVPIWLPALCAVTYVAHAIWKHDEQKGNQEDF